MAEAGVKTLFWDVGGVLLTNGWDRYARRAAAERFGLDPGDFDDRHDAVAGELETGRLGIDAYLDRVVFCRPRDYSREDFLAFMCEQSKPHEEVLAVARELARRGEHRMATLNDESAYLNDYRIRTFGLEEIFELFFSSCYVGFKKPSSRIFELALAVTRSDPKECLFIDDRAHNVEAAREARLYAIHHTGELPLLVEALGEFGIAVEAPEDRPVSDADTDDEATRRESA